LNFYSIHAGIGGYIQYGVEKLGLTVLIITGWLNPVKTALLVILSGIYRGSMTSINGFYENI